MNRRISHVLLLASAVVGLGCQTPVPPAGGPEPREDGGVVVGPDGAVIACARPAEGCPCDGEPPQSCYPEPTARTGGELVCHVGTRYCRSGTWSVCESITDFTLNDTSSALLTGPSVCNPCNPTCYAYSDVPGSTDLTPGNSSGAEYDPGRGGIRPVATAPVTPPLADTDGDGVPDVADSCVGPGAFTAADGSCYGDTFFYHSLPLGAPAVIDSAPIRIQIRTADIYFLMDTTGSMGGELANLQAGLTSGSYITGCGNGVIGAIRCTMPDAWFGVGSHDDYPYAVGSEQYGWSPGGDIVFSHRQDIAGNIALSQTAVNGLVIHNGNDGPESQIPAIWSVATGSGLGAYSSARTGCPAGTWGYPCFRNGTIPIVIYITDAPFHNGPSGAYSYCMGTRTAGSYPSTYTAVSGNERMDGSARDVGTVNGVWIGFSGDTSSMANDVASPCCSSNARDAVFRFRLTSAQTTVISTVGSSYDTVLCVYNITTGAWVACDDDSGGSRTSLLTLSLGAGDYYAVVDGYSTNAGAYRFSVGTGPVPGCSGATHTPPTFDDTVAALVARNIRVIAVQSCGSWTNSYCLEGESHAQALGTASGSLGSSGSPYVLRIAANGTGLSSAIVNAVTDLANYSAMDITARASGDTMGFTQSITAVSWGPGTCAGISGGTTFLQCLPGAQVNFNVSFRNNAVASTMVAQVFTFYIEVVGNGTVVLARIPVRIVVPPAVGAYAATATYWHDYDSTTRCAINERPVWGTLTWNADIPAGTSIVATLRSADSLAALPTATPVATINLTNGAGMADIAAALMAAGVRAQLVDLRVFLTLNSSADRTQAPVLNSMGVNYTCVPAE